MRNTILLLFTIIFLTIFFSLNMNSLAATYRTNTLKVETRVGNPPTATNDTLSWTIKINDQLEYGGADALGRRSYNRMMADISNGAYEATKRPATSQGNIYWCTFIVIDSFNLAGISGLSLSQAAVDQMVKFWKRTDGYLFIDYLNGNRQSELSKINPGDAIFFQTNVGSFGELDHTAIVKNINIDQRGNGTLTTIDSNLPWKTVDYTVVNWNVKSEITPLIGFGKYIK